MFTPIHIERYNIYDIFHNDNNEIIIVVGPENRNIKYIKYIDNKNSLMKEYNFKLITCPHNHTDIYSLNNNLDYSNYITLNINNEIFDCSVNKYPTFNNEIIMSTMVKYDDNIIVQWIKFHHNLGVKRFIIYDNKNSPNMEKSKANLDPLRDISCSSNLREVLKDYIIENIVILIEWKYPKYLLKSGVSGQTTHQNHSIYSFKNCYMIGLFDVDEYINLQNNTNIEFYFKDIIKNYNYNINNIGGFQLLNKFFYNPENSSTNNFDFLKIINCDKIKIKGNEKTFVFPKNSYIYSVHSILLGKKIVQLSSNEIYFNHYIYLNKKDRGKKFSDYTDNSILKHLKFLEN